MILTQFLVLDQEKLILVHTQVRLLVSVQIFLLRFLFFLFPYSIKNICLRLLTIVRTWPHGYLLSRDYQSIALALTLGLM